MKQKLMMMLPGIQPNELFYLENMVNNLNEEQFNLFLSVYSSKRKSPDTILICTILGFVVVAGIQRFVLGQIAMGILYLFTGGLCLVGTIVDLVNHKTLATEYNQRQALETVAMITR